MIRKRNDRWSSRACTEAGNFFALAMKPDQKHVPCPRRLQDIAAIARQAARAGVGNIIWAGWQPGGADQEVKFPDRLAFGANFIMVSKSGLLSIGVSMQDPEGLGGNRGHWDLDLKHWCGHDRRSSRSCYIFPPIGSFVEHESRCATNEPAGWVRPTCWTQPWSCPGTRRSEDPQRRQKWLYAFGRGEKGEALCALDDAPAIQRHRWLSAWTASFPMPVWRSSPEDADQWNTDPRALRRNATAGDIRDANSTCPQQERERKRDICMSEYIYVHPCVQGKAMQKRERSIIRGEAEAACFRNSDVHYGVDRGPNEPSAVGPALRCESISTSTIAGPSTGRQKRRVRQVGQLMGYRYWVRDANEAGAAGQTTPPLEQERTPAPAPDPSWHPSSSIADIFPGTQVRNESTTVAL